MVDIKDKNIVFYLETILNKSLKDICNEDLKKVDILVYDGSDNEKHKIILDDIFMFENLKKVTISNALIKRETIEKLKRKNITSIRFDKCAFDNDDDLGLLNNVSELEIIKSFNDSYNFLNLLNNLRFLAIANPYTEAAIDASTFSNMCNLKFLILQGCIVDNFVSINKCSSLELLNVLWTDLPENLVSIFNEMISLRELYITKRHNLDGLNQSIIVKNDLRDFLFEEEENKKPYSI